MFDDLQLLHDNEDLFRLLNHYASQGAADREAWAVTPWLAVDRTEPAGAVEIAVPVRDRSGRVVAALSALAGTKSLTEDVHPERAAVLLRAAKAAGQAVGDV